VVEEDMESLGIRAGKIQLQKIYLSDVLKYFWNEGQGLDHSAIVNLDWCHPVGEFCFSPVGIQAWFKEANLVQHSQSLTMMVFHKFEGSRK
jgi:hypothetical protein